MEHLLTQTSLVVDITWDGTFTHTVISSCRHDVGWNIYSPYRQSSLVVDMTWDGTFTHTVISSCGHGVGWNIYPHRQSSLVDVGWYIYSHRQSSLALDKT